MHKGESFVNFTLFFISDTDSLDYESADEAVSLKTGQDTPADEDEAKDKLNDTLGLDALTNRLSNLYLQSPNPPKKPPAFHTEDSLSSSKLDVDDSESDISFNSSFVQIINHSVEEQISLENSKDLTLKEVEEPDPEEKKEVPETTEKELSVEQADPPQSEEAPDKPNEVLEEAKETTELPKTVQEEPTESKETPEESKEDCSRLAKEDSVQVQPSKVKTLSVLAEETLVDVVSLEQVPLAVLDPDPEEVAVVQPVEVSLVEDVKEESPKVSQIEEPVSVEESLQPEQTVQVEETQPPIEEEKEHQADLPVVVPQTEQLVQEPVEQLVQKEEVKELETVLEEVKLSEVSRFCIYYPVCFLFFHPK